MKHHGQHVTILKEFEVGEPSESQSQFLVEVVLHAADISNPFMPPAPSQKWCACLNEEFTLQAEKEAELGLPVTSFMSGLRDPAAAAKSLLGFIDFVIIPFTSSVFRIWPELDEMRQFLDQNRAAAAAVLEEVNNPGRKKLTTKRSWKAAAPPAPQPEPGQTAHAWCGRAVWRHTIRGEVPNFDELKAANRLFEEEEEVRAKRLDEFVKRQSVLEDELAVSAQEYKNQLEIFKDLGLENFLENPEELRKELKRFLSSAKELKEMLEAAGFGDVFNDPSKLEELRKQLDLLKQVREIFEKNGLGDAFKELFLRNSISVVSLLHQGLRKAFEEFGFSELFEDPYNLKGFLRNYAKLRDAFRELGLEYLLDSAAVQPSLKRREDELARAKEEAKQLRERLAAFEAVGDLDSIKRWKSALPAPFSHHLVTTNKTKRQEASQLLALMRAKGNADGELAELRRQLEEKERERQEAWHEGWCGHGRPGLELNRPVMIQFSEGGSAFVAGKSLPNEKGKLQASILGAVAGAHFARAVAPAYGIPVLVHSDHCAKKLLPWFDGMLEADEAYFKEHGEPLFSSHMLDLSEEPDEENIAICEKYLKRMAPMKIILEMEIGITGGVEDGVDNSGAAKEQCGAEARTTAGLYDHLFTIDTAILKANFTKDMQDYAREQIKASTGKDIDRPLNFVFHGGSGFEKHHIATALNAGVVKMNVDTDTQWAYWEGLLKFYKAKEGAFLRME
eukprot:g2420.t1